MTHVAPVRLAGFTGLVCVALACGSTAPIIANDPTTSGTPPPTKPIAAFLSPVLITHISPGSVGDSTTTAMFRMASNRIALAVMQDGMRSGHVGHAMQALVLPDDVIDAALLQNMLCDLDRTGQVKCADLVRKQLLGTFTVGAESRRLFLATDDQLCALNASGSWSCFRRELDDRWLPDATLTVELNRRGPAAEPVPDSACFLTRDHKLYCYDPEMLATRERITDVTFASVSRGRGDFSGGCAVRTSGSVACWTEGLNETGVLGNGTRGPVTGPDVVLEVRDAIAVSREPEHACALTASHDVWCWGTADGYALGDAAYRAATKLPVCKKGQSPGGDHCITRSPLDRTPHQYVVLTPRLVPELHGVLSIATGYERTCGVRGDGRPLCVGGGNPGAWTAALDGP
jgi:hypothetical protein